MDVHLFAPFLSAFAYGVSGSIALWTAAFAFYGLRKERGRPFALLAAAVFIWDAAEAVMTVILAAGPPRSGIPGGFALSRAFGNIANFSYSLIPALLYVFARGDGFRGLRGWRGPLLFGVPIVANVVLWLTPMRPPRPPVLVEYAFDVQLAAGIVVVLLAARALVIRAKDPKDSERSAVARVLVGAFTFSVFFGLFQAGAFGRPSFNPSPIITALAVGFVATGYRRLDPFTAVAENEQRLKRFEFIVDASTEYMSIINRDRRYEAVNTAFCEAMGRPREEIVGMNVRDFSDETTMNAGVEPALVVCFNGETRIYRHRSRFGLVEERDLEITYYPFTPNGAKEPTHAVVVAKDVTDYVRKETELEEARRAADASNKAKGDFLASMSHEIRTPINAIMGLTELALKRELDVELKEDLETVKAASNYLLAIVNDILDLSKIESGRLRLEKKPFAPAALVEQIVKAFRPAISRKGITLELLCDRDLPPLVTGDSLRFSQILYNLIGNAVKFTEKGGVSVRLSQDGGGQGLRIEVRDTGIGIEAAKHEAIFQSFTQAEAGTSRRFGGSGLGLTISRRLARLMGGEITIESRLGEGSRFVVTTCFEGAESLGDLSVSAPVALPYAETFSSSARPSVPAAVSPTDASTPILLVEDNEMNARVVRRFLQTAGRSAAHAVNGPEAIKMLRERNFVLVLMDVEMPGMDGLETTRRIRAGDAGEQAKNVTVIAMTAQTGVEARSRCAEAGMDEFVSKPVDFAELEALLPGIITRGSAKAAVLDPSGTGKNVPLLNRKEALIHLGGDEDLLKELYGVLCEEATERTGLALRYAETTDFDGLRAIAHKVRGSAASICAERLSSAAANLELAAAAGDARAVSRALDPFMSIYAATVKEAASYGKDKVDNRIAGG